MWFFTVARVCCIVVLSAASFAACAADASLDAKRKAGAQFLREGKLQEAAAILREVAASPDADYRDHLTLARAYDRFNRPREAVAAYRKIVSLVSESTRDADEKSARGEAERRLKVLDPVSEKVRQARSRFLKELDGLERDAELAHSDMAQEDIFKLRLALLKTDPNANMLAFTVLPNPVNFQDTGFQVVAGQVYRCHARGVWRMGTTPADDCNANGLADKRNQVGPIGMLLGAVDQKPPYINLGVDVEFTAPSTGILGLGRNQDAGAVINSGSLSVLIERK
jgi:hypothetical protein